jgi:hypothetical protein
MNISLITYVGSNAKIHIYFGLLFHVRIPDTHKRLTNYLNRKVG